MGLLHSPHIDFNLLVRVHIVLQPQSTPHIASFDRYLEIVI
jgi:hypothetical protein